MGNGSGHQFEEDREGGFALTNPRSAATGDAVSLPSLAMYATTSLWGPISVPNNGSVRPIDRIRTE